MSSQSDSNVFSVRIVSLDYYMAPPIPDLDICTSSFQGRSVEEVPVIRIYGSTLAGQKTCLHVHRALPYLYVPCSDVVLQTPEEGLAFTNAVSRAVEKALRFKSSSGLKRHHVHGCNLVRAKKFYGYHSSEELFVKIFLYYPNDVARAAALLLGGTVLNSNMQPYESHIPFLLQFLVDYNLYGMSHIHTSKVKFRHPLPDGFISKATHYENQNTQRVNKSMRFSSTFQADSSSEAIRSPTVWLSSTVPSDWVWPLRTPGNDVVEDKTGCLVKRQSICELEGDVSVDGILNQKAKVFASLSQIGSDMKMVQSLLPIWEEEFDRTGLLEMAKSPDLSKPLPETVLRSFFPGFEYENTLSVLCSEAQETLSLKIGSSDMDKKSVQYLNSCSDIGISVALTEGPQCGTGAESLKLLKEGNKSGTISSSEEDDVTTPSEQIFGFSGLDITERENSKVVITADSKVADAEALGLLNWLASSQAAEDLNSDDELVHETILSPLLHTTAYEKALVKAHLEYESASQQECQDILDSIECLKFENLKEKPGSSNGDSEHFTADSSDNVIPQYDGSSNDHERPQTCKASEINTNSEMAHQIAKAPTSKLGRERKGKKLLWGSLPLSIKQKKDKQSVASAFIKSDNIGAYEVEEDSADSSSSGNEVDKNCDISRIDAGSDILGLDVGEKLTGSSVRDLMRRKRRYHTAVSQHGNSLPSKVVDETQKSTTMILENNFSEAWDLRTCSKGHDNTSSTVPNKDFHALEDIEMAFSQKPPTANQMNEMPEDSSVPASVKRQGVDDLPTFFTNNVEEGKGVDNKSSLSEVTINFSPETVLGLPTHFQNDGSFLYLLTFGISPPSFDSVLQWLLAREISAFNHDAGTSRENLQSPLIQLPLKSDNLLGETSESLSYGKTSSVVQENPDTFISTLVNYEDRTGDACFGSLPESNVSCDLEPELDHVGEEHISDQKAQRIPSHADIGTTNVKSAGIHIYERIATRTWPEISQISGPDEKSKLTPLSQIGFRDPASVGGGQQLTLLSVEVQAEARGDLRPNPQFDAINVIALAIQEDNDHDPEVYVLVRDCDTSHGRNADGVYGCKFVTVSEERCLFDQLMKIIHSFDPDILMGWEIQGGSLGFLAERAAHLGIGFLKKISRTPSFEINDEGCGSTRPWTDSLLPEMPVSESSNLDVAIIEDEWGRTHASGIHVGGRIVLNIWRLMRAELKLNMYTFEAVVEEVLRRKVPAIPQRTLQLWFSGANLRARFRCIDYVIERARLNLQIINQLDMINRTSELARVFGIDFFSVLSRGSQFRVESMLLRLAHTQNYLAISPGNQQVASQPAMECLPLVMEPESGFYADPVVVLDFQSLYPSMIIAYNLCFSTCLGKVVPSKENVLGVSSFSPDPQVLVSLNQQILLTPNGVMYVPSKVRRGVLPRLLEEILSTRIMVKQAMKKLMPSQGILQRVFNARQLALKLISNVTYGYTAAGFSGRMPCAELADSIVQCGRRTLETAISFVNAHNNWNARVIYGDTDSMFVLLKGRSVEEAFKIGNEIASAVTAMNPNPVALKLEKVYCSCFLLTKKRYVGYSYESPGQDRPTFDAKGIETVRRDSCPVVVKTLEQSLRIFFEHHDNSRVKSYLQRQWTRILAGKVCLQDFIFAKEVRLGSYSPRASLPPAAIVATKAMKTDPRSEPRYGERIPYVVIHGEPGARLIDMVVDPLELLDISSVYRLNDTYYINKQIIPALQRVFGLLGADLNQWFSEITHPLRLTLAKRYSRASDSRSMHELDDIKKGISKRAQLKRSRIDNYYSSKHCTLCGDLVQVSAYLCDKCLKKGPVVATALVGITSKLEREIQHLSAICRHCGGGDWIIESGVKCNSLACSVFYERRKIQKELNAVSAVATEAGFYPRCMVEWF